MSNAPNIIRKITARNIVGNVKAYAPTVGKDGSIPKDVVPLYRVFGQASGIKKGDGDYGPYAALTGRFEAVSLTADDDGVVSMEKFAGPQCYLPEPVHSLMVDELARVDGEGKRVVDSLDFAFEVGVKASGTPVGYEYTCTTLIEHSGSDPLAALREQVAALPLPGAPKVAALEAPKEPDAPKAPEAPPAKQKGRR